MINRALKTEFIKSWDPHNTDVKEKAARFCDILAPCSCYACGNQRHNDWQNSWEMLTLAERKGYNSFIDQMTEVNLDDNH
jgi:hypothetical protein